MRNDVRAAWRRAFGALLTVLAASALGFLFVKGFDGLHWDGRTWVLSAMAGGVVLALGVLIGRGRFSLRAIALAAVCVAALGAAVRWNCLRKTVVTRVRVPGLLQREVRALIEDGLVATLVKRNEWTAADAPIKLSSPRSNSLEFELMPLRDARVANLDAVLSDYVDVRLIWFEDGQRAVTEEAAVRWYEALATRFGVETADAVIAECAQAVDDPELGGIFEHIHDEQYRHWQHLKL